VRNDKRFATHHTISSFASFIFFSSIYRDFDDASIKQKENYFHSAVFQRVQLVIARLRLFSLKNCEEEKTKNKTWQGKIPHRMKKTKPENYF
jgi:hypothetical protein